MNNCGRPGFKQGKQGKLGTSGVTEAVGALRDFSARGPQLIEDCAKDGGEEFFTEMHCGRSNNKSLSIL